MQDELADAPGRKMKRRVRASSFSRTNPRRRPARAALRRLGKDYTGPRPADGGASTAVRWARASSVFFLVAVGRRANKKSLMSHWPRIINCKSIVKKRTSKSDANATNNRTCARMAGKTQTQIAPSQWVLRLYIALPTESSIHYLEITED